MGSDEIRYEHPTLKMFEKKQEQEEEVLKNKLPSLASLILYGCLKITNFSMQYISKSKVLRSLNYLDLRSTSVNDQGMENLYKSENCHYLQYLNLSMQDHFITDATLESITKANAANLMILIMQNCHITDEAMRMICECERLESLIYLDLSSLTKNSDKGFSVGKSNPKLTDTSMRHLKNSKFIMNLVLKFYKARTASPQS